MCPGLHGGLLPPPAHPTPPPPPAAVCGRRRVQPGGCWGTGGTNERQIRSGGAGRALAGATPLLPLSPARTWACPLDVPAERGGRGNDPRFGPATLNSLLPGPCLVAAGLSGVAPGDQDGGRSALGLQRGQVSKRILGVGIEYSLESQTRDLEMRLQFLEREGASVPGLVGVWLSASGPSAPAWAAPPAGRARPCGPTDGTPGRAPPPGERVSPGDAAAGPEETPRLRFSPSRAESRDASTQERGVTETPGPPGSFRRAVSNWIPQKPQGVDVGRGMDVVSPAPRGRALTQRLASCTRVLFFGPFPC